MKKVLINFNNGGKNYCIANKVDIIRGTWVKRVTFFNATEEELEEIEDDKLSLEMLKNTMSYSDDIINAETLDDLIEQYEYADDIELGIINSNEVGGNIQNYYNYFNRLEQKEYNEWIDVLEEMELINTSNKLLNEKTGQYKSDVWINQYEIYKSKANDKYYIFANCKNDLTVSLDDLTAYDTLEEVNRILDFKEPVKIINSSKFN